MFCWDVDDCLSAAEALNAIQELEIYITNNVGVDDIISGMKRPHDNASRALAAMLMQSELHIYCGLLLVL